MKKLLDLNYKFRDINFEYKFRDINFEYIIYISNF